MNRGTVARIDLAALQHNLQCIKQQAPDSRVWAVIKADAYGHGSVACAQALSHSNLAYANHASHADGFAVATLEEAKTLRSAGITQPILLLEGAVNAIECQQAAELQLSLMIHHQDQVDWLDDIDADKPLSVWLKADTGMHRLGVPTNDVATIAEQLQYKPQVATVGIASHFACSDDPGHPMNLQQISRFNSCAPKDFRRSLANSAAIWNYPESHFDWVRPGIALYGASPVADVTAAALGLKPVMHLTTQVIAERWIAAGDTVGYGGSWRADKPSRIATLAIGYADGYPRHAPVGTPVWIKGHLVPLIGRVSMDMITVDVTDIAAPTLYEQAELWGNNLPVDQVAAAIGTISYELLTRVSPRVPRL